MVALDVMMEIYKTEANKIPEMCRCKPCIFESKAEDVMCKWQWERIQETKKLCPKICPNWNGNEMQNII